MIIGQRETLIITVVISLLVSNLQEIYIGITTLISKIIKVRPSMVDVKSYWGNK